MSQTTDARERSVRPRAPMRRSSYRVVLRELATRGRIIALTSARSIATVAGSRSARPTATSTTASG